MLFLPLLLRIIPIIKEVCSRIGSTVLCLTGTTLIAVKVFIGIYGTVSLIPSAYAFIAD